MSAAQNEGRVEVIGVVWTPKVGEFLGCFFVVEKVRNRWCQLSYDIMWNRLWRALGITMGKCQE